jgi:integrase
MPRRAKGLTAAGVRTLGPGRYGDGDGLYLFVRRPDAAFWVFRYVLRGHMREMGLGRARGLNAVPLSQAREAAAPLRRLVRNGLDPLDQREATAAAALAAAQAERARAITFRRVTEFYLDAHEAGWRNVKHRQQWENTLKAYAYAHMGDLPVGAVGTEHVLAALEPIWRAKPETASRVRGRIESVLDYAKTREWRVGENPARWKGHLDHLLPARSKVAKVEHHAALPWQELGAFIALLRQQVGVAARALEFAILTAARTGEVIGAAWQEIDLQAAMWTVPSNRMKAGREHRVPLSAPALALLGEMAKVRTDDGPASFVFPGMRRGQPLSNTAMLVLLRRMERTNVTAHGFRSTFRDWAAEATNHSGEVAEAALAHTLRDKTEAAYQRGDLFEKRRRLMADWAEFCGQPSVQGDVVPLRRAG